MVCNFGGGVGLRTRAPDPMVGDDLSLRENKIALKNENNTYATEHLKKETLFSSHA